VIGAGGGSKVWKSGGLEVARRSGDSEKARRYGGSEKGLKVWRYCSEKGPERRWWRGGVACNAEETKAKGGGGEVGGGKGEHLRAHVRFT
jgi:hypothetical protein